MIRVAAATALCLHLTGATHVQAAPGRDRDPKIGKRITITGCVHKGTSRNSFVLLGATERPAEGSPSIVPLPLAIYWLDSTRGLKRSSGSWWMSPAG